MWCLPSTFQSISRACYNPQVLVEQCKRDRALSEIWSTHALQPFISASAVQRPWVSADPCLCLVAFMHHPSTFKRFISAFSHLNIIIALFPEKNPLFPLPLPPSLSLSLSEPNPVNPGTCPKPFFSFITTIQSGSTWWRARLTSAWSCLLGGCENWGEFSILSDS